jgi:hypothetical protein
MQREWLNELQYISVLPPPTTCPEFGHLHFDLLPFGGVVADGEYYFCGL